MPSGGARSGAGRKPKAVKFETEIGAAERLIADRLPELLDNLLHLANGGYERVKEKWQPAGLIFVGSGEWATLAFPHLPPEQLVCIERTSEIADKDRAANIYLVDRVMGKPSQRLDIDPDPDGALDMTAEALNTAAQELATWREQMRTQLSSQSAPPMPPTSPTSTE